MEEVRSHITQVIKGQYQKLRCWKSNACFPQHFSMISQKIIYFEILC